MSLFTKLSGKIIHHQSENWWREMDYLNIISWNIKQKSVSMGGKKVLNEWEDKKLSKYICPCIYL